MDTCRTRPQLGYQPIRLTDEEKQNPHLVLDDFFSCFHLHESREILWDWLVAALSSESGAFGTGYARSNLFFVYENMERLIEATHAIHRRRRKSMKRKQKMEARSR